MKASFDRLAFVCTALALVCVLCFCLQLFMFDEPDNLVCVTLAVVGGLSVAFYLWSSRPFDDAPLSTLAILGLCITSYMAGLVSQTVQGDEFTRYLRTPIWTFSVLLVVQWVTMVTHYAYRKFRPFYGARNALAVGVWSRLGAHETPKPMALWLLGGVGLASMLKGGASMGDASGKALEAMTFMVWMPFLILVFQRVYGEGYASFKKQLPLVLLYASLIFMLGMALNVRQFMLIGPVTAMLLYMMVAVRDPSPMPGRSMSKVFVMLVLGAAAVSMMADLATAMAVVRDKRDNASKLEFIEETYLAFQNKSGLQAYRDQGSVSALAGSYDETYLSNPVLNRFSETKFHDNMLFFSSSFSDADREEVIRQNKTKLLMVLPQPVLDALEIDLKKYLNQYSLGDVYVNAATGSPLGGFITGSIWADAWVIFDVFAPFVLAVMFILIFIVLDSMSRLEPGFFISPVGLCMAWTIFLYGMGGESFAIKGAMYLRDIPQKMLLYVLLYQSLKFFMPGLVYKSGLPAVPAGIPRTA